MIKKIELLLVIMAFLIIPFRSFADIPEPIFEPFSKEGVFVEVPGTIGALIVGVPVVMGNMQSETCIFPSSFLKSGLIHKIRRGCIAICFSGLIHEKANAIMQEFVKDLSRV